MRRLPCLLLLLSASLLSAPAMAGPQEDQRARNAVRVLDRARLEAGAPVLE